MTVADDAWHIYRGIGEPHDRITSLPPPPPWRAFDVDPGLASEPAWVPETRERERRAGSGYRPDADTVQKVNAALYLRRPLLITGAPGTGKSTLASAIAYELKLGRVLRWNVTSRVTLRDGLYQYDPLARLYAASRVEREQAGEDLGRYLRLGPLGTALLPRRRPRVLLIDEVDKADLDLPNDLLTIFEDGEFEIPELLRNAEHQPEVEVGTIDGAQRVVVRDGRVRCSAFPIVVMTSNGEREFPPAFLRRCVQVSIATPDENKLRQIIESHLPDMAPGSADVIRQFLEQRGDGRLSTDQLLNAIYLVHAAAIDNDGARQDLAEAVMTSLVSE
ncbi:AAA family ATPase [Paractinoplanes atraurantiacus]|uniref:AAA domain (Dynein-related subfamily) n=1 Tax=Paractinoplanes atraurantiacus TaxID=1036182 RepID=A0A285KMD9_9ACTN|nr:MoxR family ATPase [Actinoplanes atraurantiacus]SNY73057.1 AAA domain (dynein-related subfamily) [Actinoplanes atraurantiacus]